MNILLTGATGFFGGLLLDELLARGHQITAPTRGGNRLKPAAGLREVDADFAVLAADNPLFAGQDAAIHAAAVVKMWLRDPSEFDRVNILGTERFLTTAAAAGIPRLIYVSSFTALGPSDEGAPRTAADVNPGPYRNDYERTKSLGNEKVRALQDAGLPVQIVYPGVMYAPGALTDGNLVVKIILDLVAKKVPGYIGEGKVRWSYTFAPAAAKAVANLLDKPQSKTNYALGGDNLSTLDFYNLLPQVLGQPIPNRAIPYWLGKCVGGWEILKARLTGSSPKITPAVVEIYKHSWAVDSSAAVRDLGYEIVTLREGLEKTVAWLRQEGKL